MTCRFREQAAGIATEEPRLKASLITDSSTRAQHKTPYVSVIFFAAVICVFALSGTFKPLAVVASGSILVIYAGVSLAVIRLRYRDGEPAKGKFKLIGGPVIPILSCLFIVWLLWQLTAEEATGLMALIGVSVVLYVMRVFFFGAAKDLK